jgi:hypothetical protein
MPTIKRSAEAASLQAVQVPAMKKPRGSAKRAKTTETPSNEMMVVPAPAVSARLKPTKTSPLTAPRAPTDSLSAQRGSNSLPIQMPPLAGPEVDESVTSLKLEIFGFKANELLDVIKHTDPKKLHAILQENVDDLLKLGFSLQDIRRIVSLPESVDTLASFKEFGAELLDKKYEPIDLVDAVTYCNETSVLETLRDLTPRLFELKFSSKNLIKVVSCNKGTACLEALDKFSPTLLGLGYVNADIVAAACIRGNPEAITSLAKSSKNLLQHGYEREEIHGVACSLLSHPKALQVLDEKTPALVKYGLAKQQLVTIGKGYSACEKLRVIVEYIPKLKAKQVSFGLLLNHAGPKQRIKIFKDWLMVVTA